MYFKFNAVGQVEHYIGGELRATIEKDNFDDYKAFYPDCELITA
jgi:hypothetical protein